MAPKNQNHENGQKDRILQQALRHLSTSDISVVNKKTINDFVNHLAAEDIVKTRQAKYIYMTMQLSRRIKNKDFTKLTQKDIENLVASINNSSDLKDWTKRDYRIILRRLVKFTYELKGKKFLKHQYPDIVAWIPSTMKKARKKMPSELLTIDDVKKLAEGTRNLRDKAFILFLYESGARIGEVLAINIKDVEFDQYGARVNLSGKTGDRKIRIIASAPAISNWIAHHPTKDDKEGWLFCGLNSETIGAQGEYRYYNKLLRVARSRTDIKKPVNPHSFRHARASELAKKLPESLLCQYFGWEIGSREASTYVHLSGRDSDKAILALHGLVEEETQEDKFSPIVCPRCKIKNDPGAKYCSGCSLGLDERSMQEFDHQREIEKTLGATALKHMTPKMEKIISDIVYQQVKKALLQK